jgi:GAF domain-containing protein
VSRTATRPSARAHAPVPSPAEPQDDEAARLQALYRTRVLDTAAEEAFDDLALLAAHVCGVPSAAVAFLDEDREWVKASVGIDLPEYDLSDAVCSYAVMEQGPLVVPDLLADARTKGNKVVRSTGLRFYAGAPVRVRSGHAIGTVCVLDVTPRTLSAAQVGALAAVARQVAVLLEWRQLRPTLSSVLEARRAQ